MYPSHTFAFNGNQNSFGAILPRSQSYITTLDQIVLKKVEQNPIKSINHIKCFLTKTASNRCYQLTDWVVTVGNQVTWSMHGSHEIFEVFNEDFKE